MLDGFLGVGIQEKNAHTDQMKIFYSFVSWT